MAIWLRAREEFVDNRFQLLFIYIDSCNSNSTNNKRSKLLSYISCKLMGG